MGVVAIARAASRRPASGRSRRSVGESGHGLRIRDPPACDPTAPARNQPRRTFLRLNAMDRRLRRTFELSQNRTLPLSRYIVPAHNHRYAQFVMVHNNGRARGLAAFRLQCACAGGCGVLIRWQAHLRKVHVASRTAIGATLVGPRAGTRNFTLVRFQPWGCSRKSIWRKNGGARLVVLSSSTGRH